MGIRASLEKKPESKARPATSLIDGKKVKKQSTLLKGAIKRKTRLVFYNINCYKFEPKFIGVINLSGLYLM